MNESVSCESVSLSPTVENQACTNCGEPGVQFGRFCEGCGAQAIAESTEVEVDACLAFVTDVGRQRKLNQDAGAVARRPDGNAVMVVADGVSHSWQAETAARLAVDVVCDELLNWSKLGQDIQALVDAISLADEAVKTRLPRSPHRDLDSPETTIVAALQRGTGWTVGWVGDSRAYVVDGSTAKLLTTDDSWIEQVVAAAEMTREQAMLDRRAHAVTQTLGMEDTDIVIHTVQVELAIGQCLMLCTDGLWGYFPDPDALAHASDTAPLKLMLGVSRWLVDQANRSGGRDNSTVAIYRAQGAL